MIQYYCVKKFIDLFITGPSDNTDSMRCMLYNRMIRYQQQKKPDLGDLGIGLFRDAPPKKKNKPGRRQGGKNDDDVKADDLTCKYIISD